MKYLVTLLWFQVFVFVYAGEEINYEVDNTKMTAYLAKPASGSKITAGVLVVHEWWGHDDYARSRANMLAEQGFVALAIDMYGDGKTAEHPSDAQGFMMEVLKNLDLGEKRFQAAFNILKAQPELTNAKLGAIGYCLGGAIVMEMARRGLPLAAVASFHGGLGALTPIEKGAVKAKVLVLNGADDPIISADQIAKFKADMDEAGADYEFINYAGAKHSFTNPEATERGIEFNLPLEYNAEADRRSWMAMLELFDEVF
jgi:dienelactone hydrolase